MKNTFAIAFMTIAITSFSQDGFKSKLWIAEGGRYMWVDSSAVRLQFLGRMPMYKDDPSSKPHVYNTAYWYTEIRDTIKLSDWGTPTKELERFKVDVDYDSVLTLHPITEGAYIFTFPAKSKEKTIFYQRSKIYTDSIKFEKLSFNTTTCMGSCPEMTLQIDDQRRLLFIGGRNATRVGYFISTLSEALYNEFIYILKTSELDRMEVMGESNTDLSTHTIEVCYNGKVSSIKTSFVPMIMRSLLEYLLKVPDKTELKQAVHSFAIAFHDK